MSDFLKESEFVVNIAFSTLTLIVITFIFYRINKRLSYSFIFVLSLYGLGAIIRVLNQILVGETSQQIRSLINSTALCLLLFSL